MVELRPSEFPDAIGSLPHNHRAKAKTRTCLHYRRFVLPAADAIEWYQDAAHGHPVTLLRDPNNPTPGDGSTLNCGPFAHEPPWPQCVTSNELPFAPDWMDGARTHFLFRQDALPLEIAAIIHVEKNRAKLQEWLLFDLVDEFSEYQGSMCVVAPNPVFRSLDKSHLDPPHANSAETVAYKIVPRQGQVVNGLNLEIANEHRRGRLAPVTHKFDDHDRSAQLSDGASQGRENGHAFRVRPVVLAPTGSARQINTHQRANNRETKAGGAIALLNFPTGLHKELPTENGRRPSDRSAQLSTGLHKEGRTVTHSEYGLLYWHPPAPLARSIRISVQTTGRRKQVEVPARGHGRPAEKYEVSEIVDVTESVLGKPPDDPMPPIAEAASRRSRRQLAKAQDQKWFYRMSREAIQYVRERMGDARHAVLIVDSYFAGPELLAFGHAIRRSDVHLRILSSTAAFKESNFGPIRAESGSQLLQILNTTFRDYSLTPEIRVLGDPPAVHDRFLVIDGSVWLLGNSLTAIGERAGMIVRLADPEPVITRLEGFWSEARTLADWVTDRAAQDAVPADNAQGI